MTPELQDYLTTEINTHSNAYIRNLVAAENAVLAGQFNIAKILRAAAYTQRTLALNATRILSDYQGGNALFDSIKGEIQNNLEDNLLVGESKKLQRQFEQNKIVQQRLYAIIQKSLQSLENNFDVLENDVNQFLNGCYNCGNLVEGGLPDVCDVCGALAIEFERFGPFYASTPEHLGQLTPDQIIKIMEEIPTQVETSITSVDDALLTYKPTETEWCAKEIVAHILETDKLFVERVQSILHKTDYIQSMPPWKLHEDKGYEKMPAQTLIEILQKTRDDSLNLVKGLTPQDWTKSGVMLGGSRSILDLGTWLANHDRGHFAQIKQLLKIS